MGVVAVVVVLIRIGQNFFIKEKREMILKAFLYS